MTYRKPFPQVLLSKFTLGDGCWEWTASLDGKGYGQVLRDGHNKRAHRVVYEWLKGPIPGGLTLDHLCRNKVCVNPAHLEPVTNAENIRRADANAPRRAMTHCFRGHAFDDENTYITASGSRQCKACTRLAGARYRARKAAVA